MTIIQNEEVDVEWTIKLCRTKLNLTQHEMAEKLGVSKESYQNYENYKTTMRIDLAIKFSKIVGIPFDSIIFFKQ